MTIGINMSTLTSVSHVLKLTHDGRRKREIAGCHTVVRMKKNAGIAQR